ncbi:EST2 [Candida pseudojiufengensis]|uniref:EST2 n=1 Tax=Candida pseudojiufengensis TaxID=497109 RepID=UPI002223EF57|nr:EST2 [Candida pseudojiufengensis]KAI5963342.1 EST2 [Candida pseudojiufengensis]
MAFDIRKGINLGNFLTKYHDIDIANELPSFQEFVEAIVVVPLKEYQKHRLSPKLKYRDADYKRFLRLLIVNLLKDQSQNVLISKLPPLKLDNYLNYKLKSNFTKSSFYMVSELESENWKRIFELLGSNNFADLLINNQGFKQKGKAQVQFFGDNVSYVHRTIEINKNYITKRSLLQNLNKTQVFWNYQLLRTNELELCKEIFDSPIKAKRFNKIKNILKSILRNDEKCRYNMLYKDALVKQKEIDYENISNNASSSEEIFSIIFLVLGKLLPLDAWGGEINKKIIRHKVVEYMNLDPNGTLNVHEITKNLHLKDFVWLGGLKGSSKQDFEIRSVLLKKYITWIFGTLLKKIVKAFWYTTETTSGEILFFPRHTWYKISTLWLEKYAEDNFIRTNLLGDEKYNYGRLKLVPKKNSFRLICVPIKRSANVLTAQLNEAEQERQKIEYNVYRANTLRPVRLILIHKLNQKIQNDIRYSTTASSTKYVANRIIEFKSNLLEQYSGKIPKLHMIKFDMKECYDRMDQKKLIEKVIGLFKNDSFEQKYYYTQYYRCDSLLRINKIKYKVDDDIHKLNMLSPNFDELQKGAWSDKGKTMVFTRSKVLEECIQQIFGAKGFTVDKTSSELKFYRRKQGIFQGFSLSSIFCDILYSSMVAENFKFLWQNESTEPFLFTRMVDDFLFLTPSKDLYAKVLNVVNGDQLEKYGAYVNQEKSQFIDQDDEDVSIPKTFQFVGLEIELETLNFIKDYKDLGVLPTTNYRTFKTLLTFLKNTYRVRLHNYIIKRELDSKSSVFQNVGNLLELVLSSFKSSFKRINAIDQFVVVKFCDFLMDIIDETLRKFMIVNKSTEDVDELFGSLKHNLLENLSGVQFSEIVEFLKQLETD